MLLDFESITYENTSFLNKNLDHYFADIIFRFRLKSLDQELCISILIENKSIPDDLIIFQLLDYLGGAYRNQLKSTDLPVPVIPFIYYHGIKDWHIREIPSFFPDYPNDILQYLPTFKFEFISLHEMSDTEIGAIDNKMIYAALMMQRYRNDADTLEKMLMQLFQSIESYTDWNFLNTLIVYSLSVTEIEEHKILEIADNTIQNFKEIIMSTYEKIYTKGEEKGIEKGIEKGMGLGIEKGIGLGIEKGMDLGIEKGKVDSLLKGFDNGLSISLLSNISDFSEEEVVRILKEHGKIK